MQSYGYRWFPHLEIWKWNCLLYLLELFQVEGRSCLNTVVLLPLITKSQVCDHSLRADINTRKIIVIFRFSSFLFLFRFNKFVCLFKLLISPLRSAQFAHTLLCQEEPLSANCSPAPLQLLCSVQLWWAEETSEKVPSEQVWHTVSSSGVPGKGNEYFDEDTWDQSCNKWNIIWDRLTINILIERNKTKPFWTKWNRPRLNVLKMQ